MYAFIYVHMYVYVYVYMLYHTCGCIPKNPHIRPPRNFMSERSSLILSRHHCAVLLAHPLINIRPFHSAKGRKNGRNRFHGCRMPWHDVHCCVNGKVRHVHMFLFSVLSWT